MSMKLYKGLDFGKNFGPVRKTPILNNINSNGILNTTFTPGIRAWAVPIKGTDGDYSDPSDPAGDGEPDRGFEWMDWGGWSNNTRIQIPNPGRNRYECPVFDKDGTAGGEERYFCNEEQRRKITDAISKLSSDPEWQKALGAFGNGDYYTNCLMKQICNVHFACRPGAVITNPDNQVSIVGDGRDKNGAYKQVNISSDWLRSVGVEDVARLIILELTPLCVGATLLDAWVISQVKVGGLKNFHWANMSTAAKDKMLVGLPSDEFYDDAIKRNRKVVYGRWVWWDRGNGSVGLLMPGLPVLPEIGVNWK